MKTEAKASERKTLSRLSALLPGVGVVRPPNTGETTGNKATAYFSKDGNYIVRDDITGALVQMCHT